MWILTIMDKFIEIELQRTNWEQVLEASGPATNIPIALREFLTSKDAEECERAYWQLEGNIVVSGHVYEAAFYAVPVLLLALLKKDRPEYVRVWILELLFQIVNGYSLDEDKVDYHERCITAAREGLWILYDNYIDEILSTEKDGFDLIVRIIKLVEVDQSRLAYYEKKMKEQK
jgi:hypothetical protein